MFHKYYCICHDAVEFKISSACKFGPVIDDEWRMRSTFKRPKLKRKLFETKTLFYEKGQKYEITA